MAKNKSGGKSERALGGAHGVVGLVEEKNASKKASFQGELSSEDTRLALSGILELGFALSQNRQEKKRKKQAEALSSESFPPDEIENAKSQIDLEEVNLNQVFEKISQGISQLTFHEDLFEASNADVLTLNSLLFQVLAVAFAAPNQEAQDECGLTFALLGDPGIGKSDIVRQFGEILGYDTYELQVEQLSDPALIKGVPVAITTSDWEEEEKRIREGILEDVQMMDVLPSDTKIVVEMEKGEPSSLLREIKEGTKIVQQNTVPQFLLDLVHSALQEGEEGGKRFLLILDEVFASSPEIQTLLQSLVQSKEICTASVRQGDLKGIIEDLKVVVTTNPPGVLSDISSSSPSLVNRLGVVNLTINGETYASYLHSLFTLFQATQETLDAVKDEELETILQTLGVRLPANRARKNLLLMALILGHLDPSKESEGFGLEKIAKWIRLSREGLQVDASEYSENFVKNATAVDQFYRALTSTGQGFKLIAENEISFQKAMQENRERAQKFILEAEQAAKPFDTLRSVGLAIDAMATCDCLGVDPVVKQAVVSGYLGNEIAKEILSFAATEAANREIKAFIHDPNKFKLILVESDRYPKDFEESGGFLAQRLGLIGAETFVDVLLEAEKMKKEGKNEKELTKKIKEAKGVLQNLMMIMNQLKKGDYVFYEDGSPLSNDKRREWSRGDWSFAAFFCFLEGLRETCVRRGIARQGEKSSFTALWDLITTRIFAGSVPEEVSILDLTEPMKESEVYKSLVTDSGGAAARYIRELVG